MIKNIADHVVCIKWGGKEVEVKPSEVVSVEDLFGAKDKQVIALEDRFAGKFAGKIIRVVGVVADDVVFVPEDKVIPAKKARSKKG